LLSFQHSFIKLVPRNYYSPCQRLVLECDW